MAENWQPLQTNMPHAPVYWITVQEHFNDLVIATYGRGFWILDDITPLQQLTPQVAAADAHLFPPRPAYRFRDITQPASTRQRSDDRREPAVRRLDQLLPEGRAGGDVAITILDPKGTVVRRSAGRRRAG